MARWSWGTEVPSLLQALLTSFCSGATDLTGRETPSKAPRPRQSCISQHLGPGSHSPIHSPVGAPGVLHDPIRHPIFFSIPNSQHRVVYLIRSFVTGCTGK